MKLCRGTKICWKYRIDKNNNCNIFRGTKSLKFIEKNLKFDIFDSYFEFMSPRRSKVFLSFIENIIIQTLITNDQKIS